MPELIYCRSAVPRKHDMKFIELAQDRTKSEDLVDNVGPPSSIANCHYLLLYIPDQRATF